MFNLLIGAFSSVLAFFIEAGLVIGFILLIFCLKGCILLKLIIVGYVIIIGSAFVGAAVEGIKRADEQDKEK